VWRNHKNGLFLLLTRFDSQLIAGAFYLMRCYSPARSLGTLHDTTTCCDFTSGGQSLRDEYKFILMRLAPNCEVFVSAAAVCRAAVLLLTSVSVWCGWSELELSLKTK